jgi:hypothetical protein
VLSSTCEMIYFFFLSYCCCGLALRSHRDFTFRWASFHFLVRDVG